MIFSQLHHLSTKNHTQFKRFCLIQPYKIPNPKPKRLRIFHPVRFNQNCMPVSNTYRVFLDNWASITERRKWRVLPYQPKNYPRQIRFYFPIGLGFGAVLSTKNSFSVFNYQQYSGKVITTSVQTLPIDTPQTFVLIWIMIQAQSYTNNYTYIYIYI